MEVEPHNEAGLEWEQKKVHHEGGVDECNWLRGQGLLGDVAEK